MGKKPVDYGVWEKAKSNLSYVFLPGPTLRSHFVEKLIRNLSITSKDVVMQYGADNGLVLMQIACRTGCTAHGVDADPAKSRQANAMLEALPRFLGAAARGVELDERSMRDAPISQEMQALADGVQMGVYPPANWDYSDCTVLIYNNRWGNTRTTLTEADDIAVRNIILEQLPRGARAFALSDVLEGHYPRDMTEDKRTSPSNAVSNLSETASEAVPYWIYWKGPRPERVHRRRHTPLAAEPLPAAAPAPRTKPHKTRHKKRAPATSTTTSTVAAGGFTPPEANLFNGRRGVALEHSGSVKKPIYIENGNAIAAIGTNTKRLELVLIRINPSADRRVIELTLPVTDYEITQLAYDARRNGVAILLNDSYNSHLIYNYDLGTGELTEGFSMAPMALPRDQKVVSFGVAPITGQYFVATTEPYVHRGFDTPSDREVHVWTATRERPRFELVMRLAGGGLGSFTLSFSQLSDLLATGPHGGAALRRQTNFADARQLPGRLAITIREGDELKTVGVDDFVLLPSNEFLGRWRNLLARFTSQGICYPYVLQLNHRLTINFSYASFDADGLQVCFAGNDKDGRPALVTFDASTLFQEDAPPPAGYSSIDDAMFVADLLGVALEPVAATPPRSPLRASPLSSSPLSPGTGSNRPSPMASPIRMSPFAADPTRPSAVALPREPLPYAPSPLRRSPTSSNASLSGGFAAAQSPVIPPRASAAAPRAAVQLFVSDSDDDSLPPAGRAPARTAVYISDSDSDSDVMVVARPPIRVPPRAGEVEYIQAQPGTLLRYKTAAEQPYYLPDGNTIVALGDTHLHNQLLITTLRPRLHRQGITLGRSIEEWPIIKTCYDAFRNKLALVYQQYGTNVHEIFSYDLAATAEKPKLLYRRRFPPTLRLHDFAVAPTTGNLIFVMRGRSTEEESLSSINRSYITTVFVADPAQKTISAALQFSNPDEQPFRLSVSQVSDLLATGPLGGMALRLQSNPVSERQLPGGLRIPVRRQGVAERVLVPVQRFVLLDNHEFIGLYGNLLARFDSEGRLYPRILNVGGSLVYLPEGGFDYDQRNHQACFVVEDDERHTDLALVDASPLFIADVPLPAGGAPVLELRATPARRDYL